MVQDKLGMGYLPDLPDMRDWRLASVGAPPALPAHIDPRPDLYPLPPYNQSSANSCTGNAVAAIFGDVDRKQGGANINPSRLQIYYDARAEDGLQGSDHGAYIRSALKVTASRGVASEESWPYDINKVNVVPPPSVYVEAERKQAIGYYRIDIRLDAMKQCLAEGYSFVLGNTLYENFYEASHTGMVPMPRGKIIGGHAEKYCGYDDALRVFIVQGSWGTFGDSGFVYFPYDYAANPDLSADGWTLRSLEESEPVIDPGARPEIDGLPKRKGHKPKYIVWTKNADPDARLFIDSVVTDVGLDGERFVLRRELEPGKHTATVQNSNGKVSPPVEFAVTE